MSFVFFSPSPALSRAARVRGWIVAAIALTMGACSRSSGSSSAATATSAAVDLTKPPTLSAPPSVKLPPIATRELANGLHMVVVEHHELPVVDFILVVRTGGEADPANRGGLASFVADMIDEGTATRSALQVADQEAYLGVKLGSGSGWDASQVTLHTTTAQLDSALALFADIVLHPTFPDVDLTRVRKEQLTDLIQLKDRAPAIADRAFASLVYGTQHPYGHPLSGTEASVEGIRRSDIQQFYETYYRPNNATLIVVGDVTPDDIQRRVQQLFGTWEQRPVSTPSYGEVPKSQATTIYLINKPGAAQSSFRLGGVGVPRSTADYFSIEVMNTILGGAFTSRLNQNLRETHGYTYGAASGFSMRQAAGPFMARAEVVAAKTDSALVEFMKELNAIRDTVSQAELDKAKRYLELQLPGEFESTSGIAGQLVPVVLYGLPLTYYNSYVEQIERVTQADVQRVARQYIQPNNLTIVVVGDRKSIEKGLRTLKVGPISIRNLEGQPVPVQR